MVGHGGSSASSYLANPTSPIPSHCASIVATSTLRVKIPTALINGPYEGVTKQSIVKMCKKSIQRRFTLPLPAETLLHKATLTVLIQSVPLNQCFFSGLKYTWQKKSCLYFSKSSSIPPIFSKPCSTGATELKSFGDKSQCAQFGTNVVPQCPHIIEALTIMHTFNTNAERLHLRHNVPHHNKAG